MLENIIYKLNSFDLNIRDIEELEPKNANIGTKWIEVDFASNTFIALYEKNCIFKPISKKFAEIDIEIPSNINI